MKSTIQSVQALQILDSRGNPTVSVRVNLEDGSYGLASVPSGASTGEHEAVELRDGNSNYYRGKGVLKAVNNVNTLIHQTLKGMNSADQPEIDAKLIALDGTPNKKNLGANAILGASIACASAAARSSGQELYSTLAPSGIAAVTLPVPMVNVINGGAHADNGLDIQEFMIVPVGAETFSDAVRMSAETFHALGGLLRDDGYRTAVGDEGGYAPLVESIDVAFDYLLRAIEKAGYEPGREIALALDVAASELIDMSSGVTTYRFTKAESPSYTASDLISLYEEWINQYPLVSIEDGLGENDWEGWKEITARLGNRVQLVGDDLFVTNTERLKRGIQEEVGNSILIKLNQIGTITETLEAIATAAKANYTSVISHRSGETSDTTISDLAVAVAAGQIKTGSMCRAERTEKYNRLLWIEQQLGDRARFVNPFTR